MVPKFYITSYSGACSLGLGSIVCRGVVRLSTKKSGLCRHSRPVTASDRVPIPFRHIPSTSRGVTCCQCVRSTCFDLLRNWTRGIVKILNIDSLVSV